MNLETMLEEYIRSVRMFELSRKNENVLQRQIDQNFWRVAIHYWRKRIDEYIK